jgi:molecular chaperone GrpE
MSKDDALPESASSQADEVQQPIIPEMIPEPDEARIEPTPIEQLAQQLAESTQRAQDNWDKFIRTQAELENLQRRSEKELQNAHKYALEKFSKELLTVMDSLELGIQASASDAPEVQKLREGMELTLKQLQTVFEKFNIETVDPIGEKFNPEQHQAMAVQPVDDAEPNTVIRVFQKGYRLNDRLLRPAMVVIAQKAAAESARIDEQA